jgi:hypothetical protein
MSAELVAYDEIRTFFEDGWIDEVLFPVKSGKEATVYCCRASPGRGEAYFALKAYRPRQERNFHNAAIYQEGRILGDARTTRAVRNKSRFGRAVEFGGWLHHEFGMLPCSTRLVPRYRVRLWLAAAPCCLNLSARKVVRRRNSAICVYRLPSRRRCWSRRCATSRSCSRVMSCMAIYRPTTCYTRASPTRYRHAPGGRCAHQSPRPHAPYARRRQCLPLFRKPGGRCGARQFRVGALGSLPECGTLTARACIRCVSHACPVVAFN